MMKNSPDQWKTAVATGNPEATHIYPIYSGESKPHELNGKPCWCRVRCSVPCPEHPEDEINFGCWRCHGEGWIEAPPTLNGRRIIHHEETNGVDDPIES